MKRLVVSISLLVVLYSLSSCASAEDESAFLAEFSIAPIIEANGQYLLAKHTVSSGLVSEPPVPFFQQHEEAVVRIDPSQIPTFMEAVRNDIETALTRSGAKIIGRGGDHPELIEQVRAIRGTETRRPTGDHQRENDTSTDLVGFSFRYSDGRTDGAVNVWGVRGEGTKLVLIVLITES